jgi:diaminohydroxyphosphoribosylaminopyrimidine deaminase/5-amino-6-(5-phosphoribosylamino)uracil reductase
MRAMPAAATHPDERFMRLALREAERGLGLTSPNPCVGAVLVKHGRVLAKGYHRRAGCPHAEIEALRALRSAGSASGATLYVTLEPCSTHGRTPPCVEAIIAAGIARVVIGAIDPNPSHAGRGVEILRAAGLEVEWGVLEAECRELNVAFNKWIVTRRPWVIAKAGLSLDGRIARPPGEGQWLTSEASRADAQRLRLRADAIVIGANTLRADDPRLTVRGLPEAEEKVQPWRVVISSGKNPLPKKAQLFTDEHRERTLVFRGQTLAAVLRELGKKHAVTCVLIEGGTRVLGEAFDKRLVDEVCFYLAPLLCGGPAVAVGGRGVREAAEAPPLREVRYKRIGDDVRMSGYVRRELVD